MNIGFIGLGHMGEPAALLLAGKGFDLTVHDRLPERGERLLAAGAGWADSPAEVAARADTVITSLPGPPQVKEVVNGANGLMKGMREGTTWIDMSTSDLHQMAELNKRFASHGVAVLESTATGGVQAAWEGHVTLFVGGEQSVFDNQRPVLEAIADRIFFMGALGNATITKLITNTMLFITQAALTEGLLLGKKAGLDLSHLLEAIQGSYAGSFVADVDGPQILDGSYDPTFEVGLVTKDLRLGTALGEEYEAPLDVVKFVAERVYHAHEKYGEHAGALVAAKMLEEASGVSLRAPWPPAKSALTRKS